MVVLSKRRPSPRNGGMKAVGAGVCNGVAVALNSVAAMVIVLSNDSFSLISCYVLSWLTTAETQPNSSINADNSASSRNERNERNKQNRWKMEQLGATVLFACCARQPTAPIMAAPPIPTFSQAPGYPSRLRPVAGPAR